MFRTLDFTQLCEILGLPMPLIVSKYDSFIVIISLLGYPFDLPQLFS
jgi:hypothetical protein